MLAILMPTDNKVVRFIGGTKIFERIVSYGKPRYAYACVVRGEESQGVKSLVVNQPLHTKIIEGILNNPIKPTGFWYKTLCWLVKIPILNKFFKLPSTKDVTDSLVGYDFLICRTMEGSFPSYENSRFLLKSCPLGTKEQIKQWNEETKKAWSSLVPLEE